MWRFSLALSRNLFSQPSCVHWNYFSINNSYNSKYLTSLSPCTVKCFFREARSLKILAHDSRWHLKTLGWPGLEFRENCLFLPEMFRLALFPNMLLLFPPTIIKEDFFEKFIKHLRVKVLPIEPPPPCPEGPDSPTLPPSP
jgi:hypothetical protein